MRHVAALALACLAGCSTYSVSDIEKDGAPIAYKSTRAAEATANCIARNSEQMAEGFVPSQTKSATGYRVVMTLPHANLYGPSAVVSIEPAAPGSAIQVRFNPIVNSDRAREVAEAFTKGC